MNTDNLPYEKVVYIKLPGSHSWVKEEDYPKSKHARSMLSMSQPKIAFVELKGKNKRLKYWIEDYLNVLYKYDYSDPNMLKLVPI